MPTANEILDELHAIREKMQARYEGKPVETIIRDLEARAAEFLGGATPGDASAPHPPESRASARPLPRPGSRSGRR